jgi:hypothetical protein
VVGDRPAAEADPFGELAVASAGGQQIEYLAFAVGQLRNGVGVRGDVTK